MFYNFIIIYNMNYIGTIKFIWNIETVWKNSLQKRTVVLEEVSDKEYKGSIAFDLIKDKVSLIDGYDVGDVIEVSLNFRSSEYNGRYYNNINARFIKPVEEKQETVFEDILDLPFFIKPVEKKQETVLEDILDLPF